MREWTIADFLERLASRQAAPGGGASAALQSAHAAALVAMVARCSRGPKFAEHEELVDRVVDSADALRDEALALAEADATAFSRVAEGYELLRDTDEQRALRAATIAATLLEAAEPPAKVIDVTERILELAEELLPVGNPNALADLSAGAQAARAAVVVAHLNMEVNLTAGSGPVPEHLTEAVAKGEELVRRADRITVAIRGEVVG